MVHNTVQYFLTFDKEKATRKQRRAKYNLVVAGFGENESEPSVYTVKRQLREPVLFDRMSKGTYRIRIK